MAPGLRGADFVERHIGLSGRGRGPAGRSQCGERASARGAGFTLTELLIAFVILAIAMMIGIPAIQNLIVRSKTEGYCREAAVLMQRTRLESIRKNREGAVFLDTGSRQLVAVIDADRDEAYDPGTGTTPATTDYELGRLPLPSDVDFTAPAGYQIVDGFTQFDAGAPGDVQAAYFRPDGSVAALGAFRIGDLRENFLEIRVEPAATARIEILKHSDRDDLFHAAGDPTAHEYLPWEWK